MCTVDIWTFLDQHMVFAFVALVGAMVTVITAAGALSGREPRENADDRKALNDAAARLRAFAEKPGSGLGESGAARDAASKLEEMSAR